MISKSIPEPKNISKKVYHLKYPKSKQNKFRNKLIIYTYLGLVISRDFCLLKLFRTLVSLVNIVLVFDDLSGGENWFLKGYSSGKLTNHVETSVDKCEAPT